MRKAGWLLLLLGLSVGVVVAKDVWKEKPYTEWNQEEARRVAFDSPWSHLVRIAFTSGGGYTSPSGPEAAAGGPLSTSGGGYSGPNISGGEPGAGQGPEMGRGQETMYNVWWISARTFRQGFARFQQLRGVMTPEQAKAFAEARSPNYVVAVRGDNMSAFQTANEDTLRSVAFLRTKRSKRKIPPARIEIQRASDGQRILTILFSFPRTVDGQPVIAPDEKSVEFSCDIKAHSISTTFALRDMKVGDEFDL